jgi:hypothetical protein
MRNALFQDKEAYAERLLIRILSRQLRGWELMKLAQGRDQ